MSARELVETGVEWLDRLPHDWSIAHIGRESWVRARLGWKGLKADEYVDDGGYPMLATPDIKGRDIDFTSAARITQARFDESPEIMLRAGDVLLSKDGSIGVANIVRDLPEPATLNGSIALLTPYENLDSRFLYYVILSRYAQSVFERLRGGAGVPHLFQRDINRIRIPLPPHDEQHAIADFLDYETAQIDALVAKQEEFIVLLRERRSAVVRVEITRGATVYPVDKLGRTAKVGNGSTPRRDLDAYWRDGDVPWLTSTVVNRPEVDAADQFVTDAAVRECHLPILEPGALLIGLIGQGPTRGMATISRVRATLSQNLAYIAPDKDAWVSEYLLWALRASYSEIRQKGAESGAAQGMLNTDDVRRVRLARPPISEQWRVVEWLDDQTTQIDALISKTEEHIALAKERRSALITAAVTGQIDVRTARKAS